MPAPTESFSQPTLTTPPAVSPGLPGGRMYGRLYLMLGLPCGLILMLLTPVGQVPDELLHFYRTYQLCRSHVLGTREGGLSGGRLPVALTRLNSEITPRLAAKPDRKLTLEEFKRDWEIHVVRDDRVFTDFHANVVYSPAGYLPQVVGVKVAELFSDRLVVLFYSARFFNVLTALALGYLALRLAPCAHASICVLALLPMLFSQMCSVSADALVNACTLLFFALVLRAGVRTTPLRWLDYLGLFLPLLVLTQMKFPYIFLSLMLLVVPSSAFGSTRRKYLSYGAIGGTCTVAYLAWYAAVRPLATPGRAFPGLDVSAQMTFIAKHPFEYLEIFAYTLSVSGGTFIKQSLGVFGYLDAPLPVGFAVAYGIFLAATLLLDPLPPGMLGVRQRLLAMVAISLSTLAVFAFVYMYWDAVKAPVIEGVQGRYLLPVFPAVAFVFNLRATAENYESRPRFLCTGLVCLATLMTTLLTVAQRFYPL